MSLHSKLPPSTNQSKPAHLYHSGELVNATVLEVFTQSPPIWCPVLQRHVKFQSRAARATRDVKMCLDVNVLTNSLGILPSFSLIKLHGAAPATLQWDKCDQIALWVQCVNGVGSSTDLAAPQRTVRVVPAVFGHGWGPSRWKRVGISPVNLTLNFSERSVKLSENE